MKCLLIYILMYRTVMGIIVDSQGPVFILEPPTLTEFANSTGAVLQCLAHGSPMPKLEWLMGDGSVVVPIAQIREIMSNGSLYFPPFGAENYRHDVHSAIYRCEAINSVGRILSREANVKAVVQQHYDVLVRDAFVMNGNTAVLKCEIPTFVKDHVAITSWVQDSTFNIYPTPESDGKYHMLPSGELLVFDVTENDSHATYRCRTVHRVTGKSLESRTHGRVVVTEHRGNVPPRYSERVSRGPVKQGDTAVLSCFAQSYPPPRFWWYKEKQHGLENVASTERIHVREGVLVIESTHPSDAGHYLCVVNNTAGSERVEHELHVLQSISVHVTPPIATVDLGRNIELTCTSGGLPIPNLFWLKDGAPLREGTTSRRRIVPIPSGTRMQILSIQREDRGMYQCFAKNDFEVIQGTSEIRLGDAYPQLIYKFIEQTIQPGPSVSLKCITTGNPTPHFTWTLDGFALPHNERLMIGQYVTVHGDVISHVNISSVRVEDGGEYQCVASNRVGTASHSARLNIYGMPYVRPMSPISAVAGKDLIIKCPVAGFPISSVTWTKDDQLLPMNRNQEVTPNGTLIILKVDSTLDRGTYSCAANNKQGHMDRKIIEIDVKVPPKIDPFRFPPHIHEGSRVHVTCVVSEGDTPLKIRWIKDGRPVQEHHPSISTHQIQDFDLALRIANATTGHNGNYTCTADNEASSSSHTAPLLVNVPPTIAPFSFNKDLSEGVRAQVTCVIEKGDPPFAISWLKDFKPIPSSWGLKIIGIDDYSSTIVLEKITSSHTGNFTCLVKNSVAEVSHTAELVVSVPPRWIIEPQDQQAAEGAPFTLDCQAEGFPKPRVSWRKSVGRRQGNYRDLTSHENGMRVYSNGTLTIHRLHEDHEGFYLCEAVNNIGPGISKFIYLTVNTPTRFAVKHRNQTARLGLAASLRCEVRGDHPIKLVWRKAGSSLDPASDYRVTIKETNVTEGLVSELNIASSTREDSGRYFCLTSNDYGRDEMTVHLYIQEPPDFPRNLHVIEKGSRFVKLGWTISLDGNSPITQYNVEYKIETDIWLEQHTAQSFVPGHQAMAHISGLRPATAYQFRLFAENELGRSQASDILDVITDGEPPGGAPRNVHVDTLLSGELRVKWEAPERDLWNGDIIGYHVGYKEERLNTDQYQYKTMENRQTPNVEYTIMDLKKFTRYTILVQAYNALGPGPMSDEVTAVTAEDVPSAPPQEVRCTALTSQSIQVSWDPPPENQVHGQLKDYKVIWENLEQLDVLTKPESKLSKEQSVVIHGLEKYTNYSIIVLASTRKGDGVASSPLFCVTEEDVPEAPAAIKIVISSPTSMIVSWIPPSSANGVITAYNLYVRMLGSNGLEMKTYKRSLSPQSTFYEADSLNKRAQYEIAITAVTKAGEGAKSEIVTISPTFEVRAAIYSFGTHVTVPWQQDTTLPCKTVGKPEGSITWKYWGQPLKLNARNKILPDGSLLIKDLRRDDGGNYSCNVENKYGSDRIIHRLTVQVPPSAPLLHATGSNSNSVSVQWKQGDDGGATVRGFTLHYKRVKPGEQVTANEEQPSAGNTEWEEQKVGRLESSYTLTSLWCGTRYRIYITAYNRIGIGSPSEMVTTTTTGAKPGSVSIERLLYINSSSVALYLENWNDGGCPILYFEIEYQKRNEMQWTLGTVSPSLTRVNDSNTEELLYTDWRLIAPIVVSALSVFIAVLGAYYCCHKRVSVGEAMNLPDSQTVTLDNKHNLEQREQYYATVRKPLRSPARELPNLERIPEYSEDIYPYATFELNESAVESRCTSAAPMQTFVYHDPRLSATETLQIRESDSKGKRLRRKSRTFKSESEEYDTLGSDSDTEQGTFNRTEYSNQLGDPGSSRERSGSKSFVRRSKTDNAMLHGPESSTSTEPSPVFERKSFPRRGRPKMLQLANYSFEASRSDVSRNSSISSFNFSSKLDPPTRFSNSIELSEAECDLDIVRSLRFLQMSQRISLRSARRQKRDGYDFTIAV